MTTEELILPYKLEQHLVEICNSNETYHKLWAAWDINKKMCQDVLSTVVMNYPHYTNHDVSHCEAIITNIEMLLGEKAIRALSPTDTWLLLHAAYLHDIGMVVECKKIEQNWESKEFQEYLHEMEDSNDDSMAKNAKFINSLGDKLGKKENVSSWPVHVRNAVTILIAEYYRRQHAETSGSYLKDMGSMFHLDFSFNNLIQERLIQLLGDIICLHTQSGRKILDLDYRTNGFNADYAHPRFIAQILRMGDLLDADNNRFNTTNEFVFGEIPASSKNHWEKHKSARHILITPDVIEYRADCGNEEVYRETRRFLSWLKEEVEFWALNWKSIMPANIGGSAPKLGKCELLLNGVPDIQGLSDLQFSISPEKAFEIIEGSNIYNDKFVFLREVIQNALDACKIQMWRDICEGKYKSWISKDVKDLKELKELQPFEIDKGVFDNYEIEVRLYNYDAGNIKIVVKDNGIGLSAKQLKKICNVGVSYSGDKARKEEIESMPIWLRPTAGFGIGLQSIFLVANEFETYSKAAGEDGIYAKVTSQRKNGYVQVSKSDKLKYQGTEIHIVIPRRFEFEVGAIVNTYAYMKNEYDVFSDKRDLIYYAIWDDLRLMMGKIYFPVKLFFENILIDTVKREWFEELKEYISSERYMFKRLPKLKMDLWDKQTCTRFTMTLEQVVFGSDCFFKGIEISHFDFVEWKRVVAYIDFYGLDAKETLTLDRKSIKREKLKQLKKIVNDAADFYLTEIREPLLEEKQNEKEDQYSLIYSYWLMVPFKKKIELLEKYKERFQKVEVLVDGYEKTTDNIFLEKKIDFKDIVTNLNQSAAIYNIAEYTSYEEKGRKEYFEFIKNVLNKKNILFSKVIVDESFISVLKHKFCSKIMIVTEEKKTFCLVIFTTNEKELLQPMDEGTKKYLIKSLLKKAEEIECHLFSGASIRRYITGIEGYESICTMRVPETLSGMQRLNDSYIISPVTVNQWEANKYLKEDTFVEVICSCKEFSNLLDYVYENQLGQPEGGKYTKQKIKEGYENFIREMYHIMKEDENEAERT